MSSKQTAILFSGGIDSVVLANLVAKTDNLHSLILFDYGQQTFETQSNLASYWAHKFEVHKKILEFDYPSLMSDQQPEPSHYQKDFVPNTEYIRNQTDTENMGDLGEDWDFIPGRNAHFILHASIYAYNHGCNRLYIGSQENEDGLARLSEPDRKIPRGNDTLEIFIRSMNEVLYQSIPKTFILGAPLLLFDKKEVVRLGKNLGVDFDKTYSCEFYPPCGKCTQCHDTHNILVEEGLK